MFSATNSVAIPCADYSLGARMPSDELNAEPSASPEWPAHYPTRCPPNDAVDLNHTVFMLVATNPATSEDTRSAKDRDSHKNHPECERVSLSCALSALHLSEIRPLPRMKRLRDHLIASATFAPAHGKIKQTLGPGHYSMWLRASALSVAHTLFKVIE